MGAYGWVSFGGVSFVVLWLCDNAYKFSYTEYTYGL